MSFLAFPRHRGLLLSPSSKRFTVSRLLLLGFSSGMSSAGATTTTNGVAGWERLCAPNAPCPRSSHQLSSLGSRIYLFGGEDGPPDSHFGYGLPVESTAVECLDLDHPGEGWSPVPLSVGIAPSPRLGHGQSIVTEPGGGASLYVFGGRQPEVAGDLGKVRSLNDLHKLDLASGAWEEIEWTGDAPSPRSYHGMVAVGHKIFVAAGMIDNQRYHDLYEFDTIEKHWKRLEDGPWEGRGGPGFCVIGGGDSLVVVAGFCGRPVSDVWEYRIGEREWRPLPDWTLPTPRSIFACGTMGSERLCVFGGELENYDAALLEKGEDPTLQASLYTSETLLLEDESSGSSGVRPLDPDQSPPSARGWTAGCNAIAGGEPCFVVFGGVREGHGEQEPSGVRLADLWILRRGKDR